jgi:hypothetical protein
VLVYVTGVPGSGKSTVCAELRARGYNARDADDGISGWFRRADGIEVPWTLRRGNRTPSWYTTYDCRYSVPRLTQLAAQLRDQLWFLCGYAANEDEIWHLVDRAFLLHVERATLVLRLAKRTSNTFGKSAHELEKELEWHAVDLEHARQRGMTVLDATRPVIDIVDELVARCDAAEPSPAVSDPDGQAPHRSSDCVHGDAAPERGGRILP